LLANDEVAPYNRERRDSDVARAREARELTTRAISPSSLFGSAGELSASSSARVDSLRVERLKRVRLANEPYTTAEISSCRLRSSASPDLGARFASQLWTDLGRRKHNMSERVFEIGQGLHSSLSRLVATAQRPPLSLDPSHPNTEKRIHDHSKRLVAVGAREENRGQRW
jgi:hypothetical protein